MKKMQHFHFEHISNSRTDFNFLLISDLRNRNRRKISYCMFKRSWRGHFLWLSSCMSFILHHKARLPELSSSPYQLQQSSPYAFLRFSENKVPRRRNCYTWGVLDIIAASTYQLNKGKVVEKISVRYYNFRH